MATREDLPPADGHGQIRSAQPPSGQTFDTSSLTPRSRGMRRTTTCPAWAVTGTGDLPHDLSIPAPHRVPRQGRLMEPQGEVTERVISRAISEELRRAREAL